MIQKVDGLIMGLKIESNGEIILDDRHTNYCDTVESRSFSNTQSKCTTPLVVHSLFKRRQHRTNDKRGDNCPIIYCLKGDSELYMSEETLALFETKKLAILSRFCSQMLQNNIFFDWIVPMPSRHDIANQLSKDVVESLTSLNLGFKGCLKEDLFSKLSNEDVSYILLESSISQNNNIPHRVFQNIKSALKQSESEGELFSIGKVKPKFRSFLPPLKLNMAIPDGKRVLLVDDVCSSGHTLISAKDQLIESNPTLKIDALCLFSPLNGRIR